MVLVLVLVLVPALATAQRRSVVLTPLVGTSYSWQSQGVNT